MFSVCLLTRGGRAGPVTSPIAGLVLRSSWGGAWSGDKSSGRSGSEVWLGRPGLVTSPVAGPVLRSGWGVPGPGGWGGCLTYMGTSSLLLSPSFFWHRKST